MLDLPLYGRIELSKELGLSPHVYTAYSKVIEPLLSPDKGLNRKEIAAKYPSVMHIIPPGSDLVNDIIPPA